MWWRCEEAWRLGVSFPMRGGAVSAPTVQGEQERDEPDLLTLSALKNELLLATGAPG